MVQWLSGPWSTSLLNWTKNAANRAMWTILLWAWQIQADADANNVGVMSQLLLSILQTLYKFAPTVLWWTLCIWIACSITPPTVQCSLLAAIALKLACTTLLFIATKNFVMLMQKVWRPPPRCLTAHVAAVGIHFVLYTVHHPVKLVVIARLDFLHKLAELVVFLGFIWLAGCIMPSAGTRTGWLIAVHVC